MTEGEGPGTVFRAPQWTQTCDDGHTTTVQAWERPDTCSECDTALESPKQTHGRARKRHSGQAALTTLGDGWPR